MRARFNRSRQMGPANPRTAPRGSRGIAPVNFSAPPKLFRIGEVMAATGLSRQTVHNYTTMGLIREAAWTDGGHRLYSVEVFERLARIVTLRVEHSLEDVLRILGPMPSPVDPPLLSSS